MSRGPEGAGPRGGCPWGGEEARWTARAWWAWVGSWPLLCAFLSCWGHSSYPHPGASRALGQKGRDPGELWRPPKIWGSSRGGGRGSWGGVGVGGLPVHPRVSSLCPRLRQGGGREQGNDGLTSGNDASLQRSLTKNVFIYHMGPAGEGVLGLLGLGGGEGDGTPTRMAQMRDA